jgi:hypothetical protein
MKNVLFFLLAMFMGSFMAISQVEQGTVESIGGGGNRNITVNGLTPLYTAVGKYVLSADAAGGAPLSAYNVNVNKPSAGATVHKAILMGVPVWSFFPISDGCITLAGNGITWDGSATNTAGSQNYYADVTSIVAPILNAAGAGITPIAVTECSTYSIDGVALLVVFSDALATPKTIVIMFGGLSSTGDSFAITLSQPIDPVAPGALLDMGLGIEFGYQGSSQYSIIDVNGARLTTAAGGADDAVDTPTNGNLITVGGLGDSDANPVDPYALPVNHYSDDELYSLLPFITNATTNITVYTSNPSNDDNVFLAYFVLSGSAQIGESILLTQETDVNPVGTDHTVQAHLQDDTGAPLEGVMVTFTVTAGPNAGATYSEATDVDGHAFFTYTDNGGPGVDFIEACFINSQQQEQCSNILEKTWEGDAPPVPVSNWALVIGIMLILGFAILRFRK